MDSFRQICWSRIAFLCLSFFCIPHHCCCERVSQRPQISLQMV